MLPKARRIQKSHQVLTVLKKGQKSRVSDLTLFYVLGRKGLTQGTVIVDKKTAKLATDRNKLKRRLRELIHRADLPSGQFILRAYPGAEKKSFLELSSTFEQILKRERGQS